MALTNRDRVGKALELLQQGLLPYVQREMKAEYRSAWLKQAAYSLHKDEGWAENDPHLDAHALLVVMGDQWNSVFKETLGFSERALVSELREVGNAWAHQAPFTTDDAYRALDSMARLLTAISAPEAQEVERQKQELLRPKFEEQTRHERRKAAVTPTEGRPSGGLLPWREIDSIGFNLFRATDPAGPKDLLRFLPSQAPGSSQSFAYNWIDSNVVSGQPYWYWLEDIDLNGTTTLHGPVSATVETPTAVTLSQMHLGNQPTKIWPGWVDTLVKALREFLAPVYSR